MALRFCRLSFGAFLGCLIWTCSVMAQPNDGPIGTVQQPIVRGFVVDAQTQEEQGLLTLINPEGRCSASMLNDYWAITAAHCVFSTTVPCAQFTPNQINLIANWTSMNKTVQVRRVITYGTPMACPTSTLGRPSDIALLQVGLHDFGSPYIRDRKIDDKRPQSNETVLAYGAGISSLAAGSGPTATPTFVDNQYRSAQFSITGVTATEFGFYGGSGATVAGGDSGGPSLIQDWNDPTSPRRRLEWRLIGVHSRCSTVCLSGKSCAAPNTWTWVSSIPNCWDASVFPVRNAIITAITDVPQDDSFIGRFADMPPEVLATKRALYANNIDEPLISPPGAAIDVPLTFARCHDLRIIQGCPVGPAFEQWAYDVNKHQVLHVESGKCLNISGARSDAGAPIILYPCSGAANEKWTITGTSTWTVKSDLTGMCLHAIPGKSGGGIGLRHTLPTPATLVQMPCDGSSAQQFSNVDADWSRRNGPH